MFKLEFNEQQLAVLASALENTPYKVAAPLIQEIQKQLSSQVRPVTAPVQTPAEKATATKVTLGGEPLKSKAA